MGLGGIAESKTLALARGVVVERYLEKMVSEDWIARSWWSATSDGDPEGMMMGV